MPYRLGETSRYRGVTLFAKSGRYQAFVKIASKRHHCGMWKDERDAAIARDRAALHFALEVPLNEPRRAKALGPASPDELVHQARSKSKERTSSPFFGVTFNSARGRWDAGVILPGQREKLWIAQFDAPIDAAIAYDRVAVTVLGPGALRNFPERAAAPATVEEMRAWSSELRKARIAQVGNPGRRAADQVGVGRQGAGWGSYYARTPGTRSERVYGFATEREASVARERMEMHAGVASPSVSREAKRLGKASAAQLRREHLLARKATASSRYVGVRRIQTVTQCWVARVRIGGVERSMGSWQTERDAAIAVDRARLAAGETDSLNFPRVSRKLGPAKPVELRAESRRRFKEATSSRYNGVTWNPRARMWTAQITVRHQRYHLGSFDREERAAEAYDEAARRLGSKTAKLNFP